MNIVEVQDNLKNFSQEQLVDEINKPSGMVPQFLVLTELGRRNRMKQDIEGRQAQNQPTVAQEVVSAAGVPQGGIMDMARSMAPKSSIEQNDGVEMMEKGGKPSRNRMDMLLAYLRSLGADEEEEVKAATGGKSIAEMINFGGDYRPVEKKADGGVVKMATAGKATREVVYEGQRYLTDGSGRVFKAARRNSMRRGQEVTNPEIVNAVLNTGPSIMSGVGGLGDVSSNALDFEPPDITGINKSDSNTNQLMNFMGGQALNEGMPKTAADSADISSVLNMTRGIPAMRDPAVIDPTTGQPYDGLGSMRQQAEQTRQADALAEFEASRAMPDELMTPFNNTPRFDPTAFTGRQSLDGSTSTIGPTAAELERAQKILELNPSATAPKDEVELLAKSVSDLDVANSSAFIEPNQFDLRPRDADGNLIEDSTDADKTATVPKNLLSNVNFTPDIPFLPSGSEDTPDELMVPFDNTTDTPVVTKPDADPNSAVSSLESEIANMLKENEEDREQDKYLALAKMGLALMSSSNPTFGGALGEAGMAGVEDLQASRKSYRADKITLLDAQRKLEQARATAAGKDKSGLTGTNIISRLNNIQSRRVDLQKQIAANIAELNSVDNISIAPEARIAQENAIETLKREVANLSVQEKTFQSLLGGIGSLSFDFDATAN